MLGAYQRHTLRVARAVELWTHAGCSQELFVWKCGCPGIAMVEGCGRRLGRHLLSIVSIFEQGVCQDGSTGACARTYGQGLHYPDCADCACLIRDCVCSDCTPWQMTASSVRAGGARLTGEFPEGGLAGRMRIPAQPYHHSSCGARVVEDTSHLLHGKPLT